MARHEREDGQEGEVLMDTQFEDSGKKFGGYTGDERLVC
jgi:hypothetical protein